MVDTNLIPLGTFVPSLFAQHIHQLKNILDFLLVLATFTHTTTKLLYLMRVSEHSLAIVLAKVFNGSP